MIISSVSFPPTIATMDHPLHSDGDNSNDGAQGNKKSNSAAYEMVPLEAGFEPTSLDVICARGKEAYNHPGNIRFRTLVQDQLHNYQSSTSKMAKSHIVREIIESVRRASPKGGFVKKVNGKWFDVGERARREKTGQQIRDLLHTQYRSSTKAKARTRKRLRKSHSANSATRAHTQAAAAAAMGVTASAASSHRGSLPARIVTLDSDTNSSTAAAARSALSRHGHGLFRRNSESDLAAAGVRATIEPDISLQREQELALETMGRDPEVTSYGLAQRFREQNESFSNINRYMGMGLHMNQASTMGAAASQGWGSLGVGVDSADGFPPLQHSGLLQNQQQRQQLSDFSGYMQQPTQPSSVLSQTAAGAYGQSSFGGAFGNHHAMASHFNHPGMAASVSNAFRANQAAANMASFQSSAAAAAMMQGQANINAMQSYAAGSNTRPQDAAFSDIFQRSGRMVRPVPDAAGTDMDPLLLPVDHNIFKEDPNNSCQPQQQRQRQQQQPHDSDEDESEQSFEEAIDNIYSVDAPARKRV